MVKSGSRIDLRFIRNDPKGLSAVEQFTGIYLKYLKKKMKEGVSIENIIRSLETIILYCKTRLTEIENEQKKTHS